MTKQKSIPPTKVEIVTNGLGKFKVRTNDIVADQVRGGNFWEIELKPILDKLQPEDVVIEVGAFIGDHTIYMANKCRKVWAFECYKESYDLLTENVSLNNCSNVVATFLAIGDKVGKVRETGKEGDYIPPIAELNSSGRAFVYDDEGTIPVSTLDTLFSDWLERLDLLLIDAEGMDYKILRGAEKLIERLKPTIIFEFNGYGCYPTTIEEYIEFLSDFGYTVKQIGHWNWLAEVE